MAYSRDSQLGTMNTIHHGHQNLCKRAIIFRRVTKLMEVVWFRVLVKPVCQLIKCLDCQLSFRRISVPDCLKCFVAKIRFTFYCFHKNKSTVFWTDLQISCHAFSLPLVAKSDCAFTWIIETSNFKIFTGEYMLVGNWSVTVDSYRKSNLGKRNHELQLIRGRN